MAAGGCGRGESEKVFTAESGESVSDVIAEVKISEKTSKHALCRNKLLGFGAVSRLAK